MGANGKRSPRPFAKRSLGQNFLVDRIYIRKIIDALGEIGSSHVIEIGPGRGALTDSLVEKAGMLTAIEMDTHLASVLKELYRGKDTVRILEMDVLTADIRDIAAWGGQVDTRIVANLPYNISTPVLRLLSSFNSCFSSALLMLQNEVVDRISAKPGNRNRGYLTVLTEAYFETEKLFEVPPRAFKPQPKVISAAVRLIPKKQQIEVNPEVFNRLLSVGFSQKRKTIANNLKQLKRFRESKLILQSLGLDSNLRPEALELKHWLLLASELSKR